MYLKPNAHKSTLNRLPLYFTFAVVLSIFTSCETSSISELATTDSSSEVEEEPELVTYDNTARFILDAACVECHNINEATAGVMLDSFEPAAMEAASGRMLARMTDINNPMPPSGNLPNALIEDIMQWVDDGILENDN